MTARPKELRPYRVAIYLLYSTVAALAGGLVLRSVMADLFGRAPAGEARAATPASCLDDVDRLFSALSARAAQPLPRGLASDAIALEWDRWSRGWEDEVAAISLRCRQSLGDENGRVHLAIALDSLENLRRELGRSGQETADDSRRVKDELAAARAALKR